MNSQGWSAVQIQYAIGIVWVALVFGVMLALRWMPRKRLSRGNMLYGALVALGSSWGLMSTV